MPENINSKLVIIVFRRGKDLKKKISVNLLLLQFCLILVLFYSSDLEIGTNAQLLNIEQEWVFTEVDDNFWTIPVVADLNSDGHMDIFLESEERVLILNSSGNLLWNDTSLDNRFCTPTVTNIDNDTELEILASDFLKGIFCLSSYGEQIWNYSKQFIQSNIIAVDVNNDNSIEIIFASPDYLHCLNVSGKLLWEYPINTFAETIPYSCC